MNTPSAIGHIMRCEIFVAPSQDGHYCNYFDMLRRYDVDTECFFIQSQTLHHTLEELKKLRIQIRNIEAIHFLHGEKNLFQAIFFKLFFIKKVRLIFYYVQHQNHHFLRKLFLSTAIFLIKLTGPILISLERPTSLPIWIFNNHLLDVVDIKFDNNHIPIEQKIDKKIFLITGHITTRKCATEIIKSLSILPTDISLCEIVLKIMGTVEPSYLKEVEESIRKYSRANITFEITNQRLTETKLNMEISHCYAVLAPYKHHYGSSGIVLKALALGRPVIFIPRGALATFAENFPLEALPSDESAEEIQKSLLAVLTHPDYFILDKYKRQVMLASRSPDKFRANYYLSQNNES